MRLMPVVFLGFGNVGQALARLLLRKEAEIAQRYDLALRVVGVATGSHGAALDQAGLDLEEALRISQSGGDLSQLADQSRPSDVSELLQQSAAEAVLESTPVNYQTGQPALDYLERGLRLGMHVVTANKGPVVHGYRQLSALAARHNRQFRFESAVMDGAPIFSLWRHSLPAAQLRSFRGILNSTTNFILTQMEAGQNLQAAIAQAQALGVAETDPAGDVEGWDAAVKVAALVNVLMDHPLDIAQVERQGIQQLSLDDVRQAQTEGKRWKLICEARRWTNDRSAESPETARGAEGDGEGVIARVAPEMVGPDDPLYGVTGTSSAVTFVSDVLGDLTLTERDPSPDTTAYGMLADLLSVSELL